ncbi:S8 family serine peptidase [Gemmata sp. JC717]|uniref:S8 family serine peptidase n=1 Tax=Gemmata algarum TaxID=2975278 RepID=UPI0021BB5563|nr:S8 family serine peptidase [Gemmata algarum]MDY3556574.1 S8 family serine peptidase [Gemmata algarum]
MGLSHRSTVARARLSIEHLEDRLTPTATSPNLDLPRLVATGAVAADRVTVVLDQGTSAAALARAPFARGVESLGFGIYSVTLTPGTDLGGALAYYGATAGVTVAAPDEFVRVDGVPNDPTYGSLYGMTKIGAPAAWDVTTGNRNFVVAVIDSGVDYNHPDLAANIWTNAGEIPGNGIDDDGNGYVDDVHGWDFANNDNDPMDDNNHGTHVAGTIGAVGNNGIGVAGVNWAVQIMPLKFLGASGGGYTSNAIRALDYAVRMGAKVSNNSWGGGAYSTAMAAAIGRARDAGHIFVAAAGNEAKNIDTNPSYPASYIQSYDNVVTVAATDSSDRLANFSNYGAGSVTLAAPGVGIYSTTPNNTYSSFSGTSMATPHVTGAIALYWSANPGLTYQQVISQLKSAVDPVAGLSGKVATAGRLNVAKMFGLASPAPGGTTPTPQPAVAPPVVVGAPVGTELVRVLGEGGVTRLVLDPHPGFVGGIAAAAGDVTGDGVADVVTAATYGGHVKVFDGVSGAEIRSFYAFAGYQGPISLAVGDLNGDGIGDLIVAANLNGHVKVFDGKTGELTFSVLVYNGYFGSIAVSAADLDGDGRNELVTAADGGAGVHVKAFTAGTMVLRDSFLATAPGAATGFSVSAGDIDGDGIAELLVSQGARVRVLDARTKAARADFFAFDPGTTDRVTVQAGRYDSAARADVVAVREVGGRALVNVFGGANFAALDSFFAGTR